MIREDALREAIAECQGERNPNANTCMKLASYYTILDHIDGKPQMSYAYSEPAEVVRLNSGSEFSEAIRGIPSIEVLKVMDEVMDTLEMLAPRLYDLTLKKLREIR